MTAPTVEKTLAGPPSHGEMLLAQLGQTLVATRAAAAACMEQCSAALMVVSALQEREFAREGARLLDGRAHPAKPAPRVFGASAQEESHGQG